VKLTTQHHDEEWVATYYHCYLRLRAGCCISSYSIFQYRKGVSHKKGVKEITLK
jgi:hypothetical protein